MSDLHKDIGSWINNWVSVYNENLEAVPCPFAKQAYIDNKIDIHELCTTDSNSTAALIYNKLDLLTQNWPSDKEVVILGFDPTLIESSILEETISNCNQTILIPRGYVALEDHPDSPEIIANETMNQGSWALVLIQSKDKLSKASSILSRQGYYKNWSKANINDVVSWRD